MVSLTRREKEVVTFVIVAFLAGLGIQHWRGKTTVISAPVAAAPSR